MQPGIPELQSRGYRTHEHKHTRASEHDKAAMAQRALNIVKAPFRHNENGPNSMRIARAFSTPATSRDRNIKPHRNLPKARRFREQIPTNPTRTARKLLILPIPQAAAIRIRIGNETPLAPRPRKLSNTDPTRTRIPEERKQKSRKDTINGTTNGNALRRRQQEKQTNQTAWLCAQTATTYVPYLYVARKQKLPKHNKKNNRAKPPCCAPYVIPHP